MTAQPTPIPDPLLVSVAEAARMLGLGATATWRLLKDGRLDVARIGRRTLIPVASVKAFAASRIKSNAA